jgi:hypothetical protein
MENNPTKKNMYVREKYTIWLFNLAEENAWKSLIYRGF